MSFHSNMGNSIASLHDQYDWIDFLNRAELREELQRRRLDVEGLVPELRIRLRAAVMHEDRLLEQQNRIDIGIDPRTPERNPTPPRVVRINPPPPLEPEIHIQENVRAQSPDSLEGNRFRPIYEARERPRREYSPIHDPRAEFEREQQRPFLRQPVSRMTVLSERTFVQEKVRSWNLKFDGKSEPEAFVERLTELRESYEFSDDEMFKALPELFSRDALTWFRNNRRHFNNWDEFIEVWSHYYLPEDYYERLEETIMKTKQGPSESGRDFVAQMQTKIRRHGSFALRKEVTVIYNNLRAEYRQYIRKDNVTSLSKLIQQIDEYEKLKRELENEARKKPASRPGNVSRPFEGFVSPMTTNRPEISDQRPRIRCYQCQELGHISRNCPKRTGNETTTVTREGRYPSTSQ